MVGVSEAPVSVSGSSFSTATRECERDLIPEGLQGWVGEDSFKTDLVLALL
jgi:hypothetical protein